MSNCKFALVFLIVLTVYLSQSQGVPLQVKKVVKAPVIAKVGIAKSVAAKIKLAAFKKWAAIKTIAKAPFLLGKKAVLLKIGAVKALAAFKAAKAKKLFGLASKKAAPAVAAVAAIPAVAAAAIKPVVAAIQPAAGTQPEVVDVYTIPVSESHYQPNAHYSSSVVSTYKDALDTPRTYSNGYSVSLLPEGELSSTYQLYSVPSTANHVSYETVDAQEVPKLKNQETDTDVVVPHNTYGVPN